MLQVKKYYTIFYNEYFAIKIHIKVEKKSQIAFLIFMG